MERLEEFAIEGKNFVYINLSGMNTVKELTEISQTLKTLVVKYPKNSLYTITNIEDVRFDSELKHILAECFAYNIPYVRYGVMIGFDGIKKMMIDSICNTIKRPNFHFAFSKEKAIEWLQRQE